MFINFVLVADLTMKNYLNFVLVVGYHYYPINSEGLKRRQFSEHEIRNIRRAYKLLYRSSLTVDEALEQISALEEPKLDEFIEFVKRSQRGIIRP